MYKFLLCLFSLALFTIDDASTQGSIHNQDSLVIKDFTGAWERIDYWWTGDTNRDTLRLIQNQDSIFFYDSANCIAKAYIKKNFIIISKGFKADGIDYFTIYSVNNFYKKTPLIESVDKIEFRRLEK